MGIKTWVEHLTTDVDAATEGVQVADIYPWAGSEGLLVTLAVVFWIGWHIISSKQESSKLSKLARRRPSPNDWKSNVTDG